MQKYSFLNFKSFTKCLHLLYSSSTTPSNIRPRKNGLNHEWMDATQKKFLLLFLFFLLFFYLVIENKRAKDGILLRIFKMGPKETQAKA